jgi:hypothetical protein
MKIFIEEQRMNKPLVIIILIMIFIGFCISVIYKWESIGQNNLGDNVIVFSSLIILIFITLFFFNLKLKTRIDDQGIYFQFFPVHFSYRLISWDEISTCYIRRYNAIFEYGGWGFRIGILKKVGRAYSVQGKIGLQIELKNGKKILIGTQKKEDLKRVIDNYSIKITN